MLKVHYILINEQVYAHPVLVRIFNAVFNAVVNSVPLQVLLSTRRWRHFFSPHVYEHICSLISSFPPLASGIFVLERVPLESSSRCSLALPKIRYADPLLSSSCSPRALVVSVLLTLLLTLVDEISTPAKCIRHSSTLPGYR